MFETVQSFLENEPYNLHTGNFHNNLARYFLMFLDCDNCVGDPNHMNMPNCRQNCIKKQHIEKGDLSKRLPKATFGFVIASPRVNT